MENKYSVVDGEDGDDDVSTSESSNRLDFAAGSNRPHFYDDNGSRDSDAISSEERYYHLKLLINIIVLPFMIVVY